MCLKDVNAPYALNAHCRVTIPLMPKVKSELRKKNGEAWSNYLVGCTN